MIIFPETMLKITEMLIKGLGENNKTIAIAESCTGGLLSALLTSVSGASTVINYGWVTYSNEAKTDCLGVDPELLKKHGAVSAEVTTAMAAGAMRKGKSSYGLSITGIAGPSGGTPEKPVGLVYIGITAHNYEQVIRNEFEGDRHAVRSAAVETALQLICDLLKRETSSQ